MIKFVAFYLRNPLIRKISYQLSASKTKQKIMTDQHEQFIASLKNSYQSLAENLESDESVLNLFQDDIDQNDQDDKKKNSQSDDAALAEYMNVMNISFAKYYSSLSPDEQLKRSKELIKSEALKKDWTTFLKPNTDYQDYSLFDKNLLAIKYNYKDKDPEDLEDDTIQNFYGDLKNDVKSKVDREKFFSFLYKNPKLVGYTEGEPDEIDDVLEEIDSVSPLRINEPELDLEQDIDERHEIHKDLLVTEENVSTDESPTIPRLSFKAKFELFTLFNEGWSVRDLSLRYGIMPYRVKAIVYQKKYFFDEVLPNIPFDYLKDLIAIEQYFEEEFGAVDYGVDLDEMKQVEAGHLTTNFKTPYRNVDTKGLSKKEEERLKKFFENKKSKKQDIVVDKFVGTGNQGYYLKSWIMHKTRSKHGVNQMFERVIKDSHKPYKLPVTAQARLQQGPRKASSHFGVK